jgi:hypothetical protein
VFQKSAFRFGSKYDHKKLEREIEGILDELILPKGERLPSQDSCKTFVVAMHTSGDPHRLRTYKGGQDATTCTIIEAARATSAAVTFFRPITVRYPGGVDVTYRDAGINYNNPGEEAINEARRIWPESTFGVLLSIGTGTASPPAFHQGATRLITALNAAKVITSLATSSNRVDNAIRGQLEFRTHTRTYFRFNVDFLGDIKLDEYKYLTDVAGLTRDYMNKETVGDWKEQCAQKLVQLKRERDSATGSLVSSS